MIERKEEVPHLSDLNQKIQVFLDLPDSVDRVDAVSKLAHLAYKIPRSELPRSSRKIPDFRNTNSGLTSSIIILQDLSNIITCKQAYESMPTREISRENRVFLRELFDYFSDDFVVGCATESCQLIYGINTKTPNAGQLAITCGTEIAGWFDIQYASQNLDRARRSQFGADDPVDYMINQIETKLSLKPSERDDRDAIRGREQDAVQYVGDLVYDGYVKPQEAMTVLVKMDFITDDASALDLYNDVKQNAIYRVGRGLRNKKKKMITCYDSHSSVAGVFGINPWF